MMFKPAMLAFSVSSALFASLHVYAEEQVGESVSEHEVIVVSGNRIAKPLKDVAGAINVVTADDIESLSINDMNQLFNYEPGVSVTGRSGGAQNVIVRGMGGDRVLMIKDGMRMNEGYGANGLNDVVGRGFIDTDTLKQVEVAKGAASSLYGSDALGGIVVFTTKDASDYLEDGEQIAGRTKLSYSDLTNQFSQAGTLALRYADTEHLLNASFRQGEEEQNYQGSATPFDIDSRSLLYKGKLHLSDTDTLSLLIDLWQQDTLGDSADGLLTYFRGLGQYGYQIVHENNEGEKETQSFKLNYHSDAQRAWHDYLDINLYRNKSSQADTEYGRLDIDAPMFGVKEVRDMWQTALFEQDTWGLLSNASKKLNTTHTLGFGLDIEQTESLRSVHELRIADGTTTRDLSTSKFPTNDTRRYGVFINDEIRLLDDRLTVTPGVRFDSYKMDPNSTQKQDGTEFSVIEEQHFSLNLGAIYSINPMLNLYAQYGQGFKVPAYDLAYIEHYLQPTSTYAYEIVPSDKDLAPEQSDTYEFGLRGHIGELAISGAIFYSKYDNFLSTVLLSSETMLDSNGDFSHIFERYQYQNLESVTIKGAELSINWYINDAWTLQGNAAYQDGKDDESDDYLHSISPLSGLLGLSYQGQALSSHLVLNWAKAMTKVNEGNAGSSGYGVLDWLVSYRVTDNLRFNLAANNLLDKEYNRYSSIAGRAEGSDLSSLAEAGRNYTASVSFSF
ncbi:TonB-dependent hemoglobin/transferrin/lactoferrin family receptor [Bowmanella sp. Y26]|uniref:TonB-dependent hemoglobin/transferrin/lactoferrin family receptor n=1 Tax=Bowmanella yangjiangensis TaxID=2811230 RepID=UPI001BDC04EC|nr:TonB-dependent hemoglobin/transferrin/lactoferrin family receptor [Bowmanella yangjiangensis]MBT1066038.1 TonB-dependent hemoglobin/transferrin/lactoferrin family receptor [Bowmanella yangjiangensis]